MEVLKSTFKEQLPELVQQIKAADFVAIDLELTGLSNDDKETRLATFDSIQQRYTKLAEAASNFLPNQFGLCLFTWDAPSKQYIVKPYNFFLFPRKFGALDRRFSSQTSSLEFLLTHNFDFNKWVSEGVSYLSRTQEEFARANALAREAPKSDINMTKEDKDFIEDLSNKVRLWLKEESNENEKPSLALPPCSAYQRRLTYQELGRRFPQIYLRSAQNAQQGSRYIEVSLMTEEQKAEKDRQRKEEAERDLIEAIGFRHVIDAIIDAKKPVLGHNMMLDLLHIYHNFYRDLPASSAEYIQTLHQAFPVIGDTKHILQLLVQQKPEFKALNTALGESYEALKTHAPKLEFPEGFGRYSEKGQQHEAAYDAFMTGALFLAAISMMYPQQGPEIAPIMPSNPRYSEVMNKLHLMRIRGYLCLSGQHHLPARQRMWVVTGLTAEVKQNEINQFFDKLAGRMFTHWVDEQTVVVEFANDIGHPLVADHVRQRNAQFNRNFAVAPIDNFDKIVDYHHEETRVARGKKRRFSDITPDSPIAAYLPSSPASVSSPPPDAKRRKEKESKDKEASAKPTFPDLPKECHIL